MWTRRLPRVLLMRYTVCLCLVSGACLCRTRCSGRLLVVLLVVLHVVLPIRCMKGMAVACTSAADMQCCPLGQAAQAVIYGRSRRHMMALAVCEGCS
jgi:hypothetical protein